MKRMQKSNFRLAGFSRVVWQKAPWEHSSLSRNCTSLILSKLLPAPDVVTVTASVKRWDSLPVASNITRT